MTDRIFICSKCMNKINGNLKFCPICGNETSNDEVVNSNALTPGICLNKRYVIGNVLTTDEKNITYMGLDKHLESKIAILELFPTKIVTRLENNVVANNFSNETIFENVKINFSNIHKTLSKFRALPNILKIYETFEENNTIYVIQEILKGTTFSKYLDDNYGELPWEHSKKMFLNLIQIIKHMHNNKIVHLALTPNTLIINNNNLKISNFNNAKFIDQNYDFEVKLNDGYSAPEQYSKENKTGTYTDIYSVAAIMYKTLTGTKPVNSTSRLSNDNLLPPNILNSKTPKNVSFAIMSALVLAPKLRTQTMKDFFDDLTAPPREKNKNLEILNKQKIEKNKKIKKDKNKYKDENKTKTRNLVFTSLLISCSILSFFLILTLFFIFNKSIFN